MCIPFRNCNRYKVLRKSYFAYLNVPRIVMTSGFKEKCKILIHNEKQIACLLCGFLRIKFKISRLPHMFGIWVIFIQSSVLTMTTYFGAEMGQIPFLILLKSSTGMCRALTTLVKNNIFDPHSRPETNFCYCVRSNPAALQGWWYLFFWESHFGTKTTHHIDDCQQICITTKVSMRVRIKRIIVRTG